MKYQVVKKKKKKKISGRNIPISKTTCIKSPVIGWIVLER